MSPLCCVLLFSVVVVHGTYDICAKDLGFINPAHWPVLQNLSSSLWNARFVNVGLQQDYYESAVVYTRSRQTFIYGLPSIYGSTVSGDVRELSEIRGRDIKDIRFGRNFLVVLEYDGNVWTMGSGENGQLSGGTTDRTKLARVQLPDRVKEIAAGIWFCVVLTTDGQLFSWGYNGYGSLGYISSSNINPNPRSFTLGTGVTRPNTLCCSEYACAVLTQHSEVYSWGYSDDIGRAGDYHIPGRVVGIPSNEVIIKLSCGVLHIVALSASGHLYGWGRNAYGELLQSQSAATYATVLGVGVKDAVAGRFLTVVRYESGTSVFFGKYNGTQYMTAYPTASLSPRDIMAQSVTGSETKGTVRLCG